MKYTFDSLEDKRRIQIIKSSVHLLGTKGIENTSLNNLLSEAKISKGFFYHYFENKDDYVKYLAEFCINLIVVKLKTEDIMSETDFIKRIQKGTFYKTIISKEYPFTFEFLTHYYLLISEEEYTKIAMRIGGNLTHRILNENIDYSLFKDDVDIEVTMKVISKYIAQITEELKSQVHKMSYEQMAEYYTNELEDLKKVVYKKGV
jgi:AcrR family transcriptional regulator